MNGDVPLSFGLYTGRRKECRGVTAFVWRCVGVYSLPYLVVGDSLCKRMEKSAVCIADA